MRIVILGANGRLGREVIRRAQKHDHDITAFVRRPPSPAFGSSVKVQIGDAMLENDVRAALTDQQAVVNTIGAGTLRRNDIESRTTAVTLAVAQNLGVPRYIAMSAGMVAVDWPIFRYILFPLIFRNILREHRRVEQLVTASLLDWTIVRPSRLTTSPATGYTTSLERPGSFSVSNQDVAAFIVDELDKNAYIHQSVFIAACKK